METDIAMNNDGNGSATPNKTSNNPNPLNLWPVEPEVCGEGLPYAPENWPKPGDTWGWRTGRRINPAGYFKDRYLYTPARFSLIDDSGSGCRKHIFPSRFAAERYIRETFPDADVDAFFASFSWRIPAVNTNPDQPPIAAVPLQIALVDADQSASDFQSRIVGCKAGNKMCNSLILDEVKKCLPVMSCDICCAEPSFCRDCTCILCCKTVDSAYGGYNYIKCRAKVQNDTICGHVAHMECALRAHLAGTVGGSIGLDAEYFCRWCEMKIDLIHYVCKLIQTCENVNSQDDIEKMLNLGAQILRGSQQPFAKELQRRIELAISKLSCGTRLEDIWKEEDDLTARFVGILDDQNAATENILNGSLSDVKIGTVSYEYLSVLLKLDREIDEVLQALQKSQEVEYQMAEDRLYQQKNYLLSLYQQLDSEKTILAHRNSSHLDVLLSAVSKREEQIQREVKKFEEMKKIANGFGRTSKHILKEHFGL